MALYRAQVVFKTQDGIAENYSTNTIYVDMVTETQTVANEIAVAWTTALANIDQLMSSLFATTGHEIKFYTMSDPEPRAPKFIEAFGMPGKGTTAGPTEVAMVLSFQGAKVSGLPQARRRGRIYFGPLINGLAGADGRLQSSNVSQFADFGASFLASSDANPNWTWAVYSPTNGTGIDVQDGWVDNEFDTQRRRGRKATLRTTF